MDHHRVHNIPPIVSNLSSIKSIRIHLFYFLIHFNIVLSSSECLLNRLFSLCFPIKILLFMPHLSLHATYSSHHISLFNKKLCSNHYLNNYNFSNIVFYKKYICPTAEDGTKKTYSGHTILQLLPDCTAHIRTITYNTNSDKKISLTNCSICLLFQERLISFHITSTLCSAHLFRQKSGYVNYSLSI